MIIQVQVKNWSKVSNVVSATLWSVTNVYSNWLNFLSSWSHNQSYDIILIFINKKKTKLPHRRNRSHLQPKKKPIATSLSRLNIFCIIFKIITFFTITLLYVMVGILLTRGKHVHDRIISLKGEVGLGL